MVRRIFTMWSYHPRRLCLRHQLGHLRYPRYLFHLLCLISIGFLRLTVGQPVPDPPDYLFEPMAPPPSGLWGASAVPYYTGTAHDDGSVPINTTAVPIEPEQSYSAGVTGTLYADENHVSDSPNVGGGSTWVVSSGPTLPSSPPITLSEGIGCCVGAGVEWERRFPTCGEGFLVLVNDSPTTTC